MCVCDCLCVWVIQQEPQLCDEPTCACLLLVQLQFIGVSMAVFWQAKISEQEAVLENYKNEVNKQMAVLESHIVGTGQGHEMAELQSKKTIDELSMSLASQRTANEQHQATLALLRNELNESREQLSGLVNCTILAECCSCWWTAQYSFISQTMIIQSSTSLRSCLLTAVFCLLLVYSSTAGSLLLVHVGAGS